jgi:hypothetical protein
VFTALIALALLGCGGGGGSTPAPTAGSIAGSLTIGGPVNSMANLTVGVYSPGVTTAIQSADLGNSTSAASGDYAGRTVSFQFTDLDLGSYEIAVYQGATGSETFLYRSDTLELTSAAPNMTSFSATMSFSGPEPWGTISGVISLADSPWPGDKYVYLGFKRGDDPQLEYPLTEGYANDGYVEHVIADSEIIFNMDFLTYGEWSVGFYGYDFTTHQVTTYGERDVTVEVNGSSLNVTGVNFPADFAGDPGTDPVLGTISGTISFSGTLPQVGGFVAVGANTIPPQAGAPISHMEITPEMLDESNEVEYIIENLPSDDYGVAIFAYDFATHTAVYFGEYPDPVSITEGAPNVSGIDFDADVSLL